MAKPNPDKNPGSIKFERILPSPPEMCGDSEIVRNADGKIIGCRKTITMTTKELLKLHPDYSHQIKKALHNSSD